MIENVVSNETKIQNIIRGIIVADIYSYAVLICECERYNISYNYKLTIIHLYII